VNNALTSAVRDVIDGFRLAPLWWRVGIDQTLSRFRRTLLGPFWMAGGLLATAAALSVVYGSLFGTDWRATFPHLIAGILVWFLIAGVIGEATSLFLSAAGTMQIQKLPLTFHVLLHMQRVAVYSLRSQSLRSAVFNLAVGGKMYKAAGDVAAVKALNDINLEITEGDRIALVGHNGSGKTTLLKVIAGIYSPTRGELEIDGDITSMIAINAGIDMEATGLRNIHKLGLMRRLSRKDRQPGGRDRRVLRAGRLHPPAGPHLFGRHAGAPDVRGGHRVRGRHPGAGRVAQRRRRRLHAEGRPAHAPHGRGGQDRGHGHPRPRTWSRASATASASCRAAIVFLGSTETGSPTGKRTSHDRAFGPPSRPRRRPWPKAPTRGLRA
jgi:energy-coupling factor transporter ATP-binding protein EcfA2